MLDQSFEQDVFAAAVPPKEGKLGDIAYSQIYEAIIDGRLDPGGVFREAALAEQFGFGLAPTRSALARLGHVGLMQSEKRRGWRVLDISGKHLADLSLGRDLLEPALLDQSFDDRLTGEVAMRVRIVEAQLSCGAEYSQAIRLDLSLLHHIATCLRELRVRRWLVETWDLCARADIFFVAKLGIRREPMGVVRVATAVAASDMDALGVALANARRAFRARAAEALAGSAAAIVADTQDRPEPRQTQWAVRQPEATPSKSRPSQSIQGEDQ